MSNFENELIWCIEASGDGSRESIVIKGSRSLARQTLAELMFMGSYENAQADEFVSAYLAEFDDDDHWHDGVWETDLEQGWLRVAHVEVLGRGLKS